jgi:hypothetical protein
MKSRVIFLLLLTMVSFTSGCCIGCRDGRRWWWHSR